MNTDYGFDKYKTKGGYHWDRISKNPFKRIPYLYERYMVALSLLRINLNSLDNKKILDDGCGDGALTYLIAQDGADMTGLDLSPDAINIAKQKIKRKKLNINFLCGNSFNLPFSENYFDAVISLEVIEHIIEPADFLKEIYRVLKPGGVVVLSTPVRFTKEPQSKYHYNEWFSEDFSELIKSVFQNCMIYKSHNIFVKKLLDFNIIKYIYNVFSLITRVKYLGRTFEQGDSFLLQYAVAKKINNENNK